MTGSIEGPTRQVAVTESPVGQVAFGVFTVIGATCVAWWGRPWLAEADLVLVYLVANTLAAVWLRRWAAVGSAVASVVAFNFFFVPPTWTFAVDDTRYVLTFAVMAVAGVLVGAISTRLRDQAEWERAHALRLGVLLDVTRRLSAAMEADMRVRVAAAALEELTGVRTGVFVDEGGVTLQAGSALADVAPIRPRGDHPEPAAWGEGWRPYELPLAGKARGHVVLGAGDWERDADARELVHAVIALLAAALTRDRLDLQAREARLAAEVEQTRNDLLSAVSHDLRTPLAAIKGASSALADADHVLPPEARASMLRDVVDASHHLERMLVNLLELTRLRGEGVRARGDWHAPEDVVGAALRMAGQTLDTCDVRAELPPEVTLVWMDPLLVEQALVNLLENAARHAPGSSIRVTVSVEPRGVLFEVADTGPGFDVDDPGALFERFARRGPSAGTGLGLAIARAVVELHGGWIEARNRPEGGASVRFLLPTGGPMAESAPSWDHAESVA